MSSTYSKRLTAWAHANKLRSDKMRGACRGGPPKRNQETPRAKFEGVKACPQPGGAVPARVAAPPVIRK